MAITVSLDRSGWSGNPWLGSDTTFDVPYIIETTSLNEREMQIIATGLLPSRGTVHPDNAYCAAASLKLTRNGDNPLIWRGVVTYKTDSMPAKESEKLAIPNPLDRPCEIVWNAVSYTKPIAATVEAYTSPNGTDSSVGTITGTASSAITGTLYPAGTPIITTANEPFDPPVEVTDYRWTATVTKFLPSVPNYLLGFPGRVNSAAYVIDGLSVATMASRLIGLTIGKRERENGVTYRQVQFTIEFKEPHEARWVGEPVPEPYIAYVLNEGYKWYDSGGLVTSGRIRLPPLTSGGLINTSTTDPNNPSPCHLDRDGTPIEPGTYLNTLYLPFKVYRTADFSLLPLA